MSHGAPDYTGQKSGIISLAEWLAQHAQDVQFYDQNISANPLDEAHFGYIVPDDVDLYITDIQSAIFAFAVADADKNQICYVVIEDTDATPIILWSSGGNGGFAESLAKPIIIPRTHHLICASTNVSAHKCAISVSLQGYAV